MNSSVVKELTDIKKLLLGVLCSFFLCFLSQATAQEEKVVSTKAPLRLGMILPLSGAMSQRGQVLMLGASLAVEKLKDEAEQGAGAGEGQAVVEVLYEDDACQPKNAAAVFSKLRDRERVRVVMGPACEESILAVARLAQRDRSPFIALGAISGEDGLGEQVYELTIDSEGEPRAIARYLLGAKITEVTILFEDDEPSLAYAATFAKYYQLGGQVVGQYAIATTGSASKVVLGQLREAVKKPAGALFLIGGLPMQGILRQLKLLKSTQQIVASRGLEIERLKKQQAAAVEGVLFVDYGPRANSKLHQSIRARLSTLGLSQSPENLLQAFQVYHLVRMLSQEMSGSLDLHSALEKLDYDEGLLVLEESSQQKRILLGPRLYRVEQGKIARIKQ